mmetsp:Transcript_107235/g.277483  ORF Transcript_107235/g.277483 Transcript_107235/m.277483 type:complete len:225 (-) Transcript_107235:1746-2420(-)
MVHQGIHDVRAHQQSRGRKARRRKARRRTTNLQRRARRPGRDLRSRQSACVPPTASSGGFRQGLCTPEEMLQAVHRHQPHGFAEASQPNVALPPTPAPTTEPQPLLCAPSTPTWPRAPPRRGFGPPWPGGAAALETQGVSPCRSSGPQRPDAPARAGRGAARAPLTAPRGPRGRTSDPPAPWRPLNPFGQQHAPCRRAAAPKPRGGRAAPRALPRVPEPQPSQR